MNGKVRFLAAGEALTFLLGVVVVFIFLFVIIISITVMLFFSGVIISDLLSS